MQVGKTLTHTEGPGLFPAEASGKCLQERVIFLFGHGKGCAFNDFISSLEPKPPHGQAAGVRCPEHLQPLVSGFFRADERAKKAMTALSTRWDLVPAKNQAIWSWKVTVDSLMALCREHGTLFQRSPRLSQKAKHTRVGKNYNLYMILSMCGARGL